MNNLKLITIIAFVGLAFYWGDVQNKNIQNKPHTCPFVTCPYKGENKFNNQLCGCDIGGDCSALDSIHFEHPDWSYDQCEEYLFAPMREEPKTDYQINIYMDTLWLYDGARLVGRIDYTKQKIDSLIYFDNE